MVVIRGFDPVDSPALARIFYDAVQTGAAGEYTQAERDAWCNAPPPDDWANARFDRLATFVALVDAPVGFMNVDKAGYVDMAFVTPTFKGQGVGRLLYEKIEAHALQSGLTGLSTYASHTARPFFEAMGWDVIRANIVEKDSVRLQNWFMIKSLTA